MVSPTRSKENNRSLLNCVARTNLGRSFICTQKDNFRRKAKVERAVLKFATYSFRPPYYELMGVKLNKDGSESKYGMEKSYSFEEWVLEEKGDREGNTQA